MTPINVTFGAYCNLERCNSVGYFKAFESAQKSLIHRDASFVVHCLLVHVDLFMPNIGLQPALELAAAFMRYIS